MPSNPVVIFVPAQKLLDAALVAEPALFGRHFVKKKTHPLEVALSSHCLPDGVRIAVRPWLWSVHTNSIMMIERAELEQQYEQARSSAVDRAVEEAREKAWKDFPTFDRWRLEQELSTSSK